MNKPAFRLLAADWRLTTDDWRLFPYFPTFALFRNFAQPATGVPHLLQKTAELK
jgi:hypothetical protein